MAPRTSQKHPRSHDALVIVSVVAFMVSMLFAFQQISGLPLSIRGTAIYNPLPMPEQEMPDTGEESRIPAVGDLTKGRVCERIVESFAMNDALWLRVNGRLLERLGFKCRRE